MEKKKKKAENSIEENDSNLESNAQSCLINHKAECSSKEVCNSKPNAQSYDELVCVVYSLNARNRVLSEENLTLRTKLDDALRRREKNKINLQRRAMEIKGSRWILFVHNISKKRKKNGGEKLLMIEGSGCSENDDELNVTAKSPVAGVGPIHCHSVGHQHC